MQGKSRVPREERFPLPCPAPGGPPKKFVSVTRRDDFGIIDTAQLHTLSAKCPSSFSLFMETRPRVEDDPPSKADVAVVQHQRLTRGHCPLGGIESDAQHAGAGASFWGCYTWRQRYTSRARQPLSRRAAIVAVHIASSGSWDVGHMRRR